MHGGLDCRTLLSFDTCMSVIHGDDLCVVRNHQYSDTAAPWNWGRRGRRVQHRCAMNCVKSLSLRGPTPYADATGALVTQTSECGVRHDLHICDGLKLLSLNFKKKLIMQSPVF